jgi:hypothetical protein
MASANSVVTGLRVPQPCLVATRLVNSAASIFGTAPWLHLKDLVNKGLWDEVSEWSIDPDAYSNPTVFFDSYQASSLLRKAEFLPTSFDRTQRAMDNFHKYEEQCRLTNRRIYSGDPTGRIGDVLFLARGKILSLLGERPSSFDFEAIQALSAWGPGVTSSVKGSGVSLYHKLGGKLHATPDLLVLGKDVLSLPAWRRHHSSNELVECPGNTLSTVPKNARTDRTIAVEPHINAFLQRGVGKLLVKKLLRWGVNLRSQERNQTLALEGSRNGLISTIDLSGASDCVSKALVEWIIPSGWTALLRSLRSPVYKTPKSNEWKLYHKWSSMGNGYTFELETLIFYSIAWAATQLTRGDISKVSCYGDDIIVPYQASSILVEALEWAGFSVNQEKSFTSPFSFFRESCGKDYFLGVYVRPMFINNISHVTDLFSIGNKMLEVSSVNLLFKRLRERVITLVPERLRYFVPKGLSDGGFHMDVGEWITRNHGINNTPRGSSRTFRAKHLFFVPRRVPIEDSEPSLGWALAKPPEPTVHELLFGRNPIKVLPPFDLCLVPSDGKRLVELRQVGRWSCRTLTFGEGAVA